MYKLLHSNVRLIMSTYSICYKVFLYEPNRPNA